MSRPGRKVHIKTGPTGPVPRICSDPEKVIVYVVRVGSRGGDYGAIDAESYGIIRIVDEWLSKKTDWSDESFVVNVATFEYPDMRSANIGMAMSMSVYNIMVDHDISKNTDAHIVYVQNGKIYEFGA